MSGVDIRREPHITENERPARKCGDNDANKKHHPVVVTEINVGEHRKDHAEGQNGKKNAVNI